MGGGDDENGWLGWLALTDQKTPIIMDSGSNNYPTMANVTGEPGSTCARRHAIIPGIIMESLRGR